MESNEDVFSPSTRAVENNQPVAIVSQLMRDVANMSHVDEVFLWLSRILVQRLDVHTVQIWAVRDYSTGQHRVQLRSFASQKPSLSQSLSTNPQIAAVAELMFREKHGSEPLPVANVFAQYQATFLIQQNIHYWAGYFLQNAVLLPPRQNEVGLDQTATPLSLAVSLFMEKQPSERILRSTQFIFEQSVRIATSRGFLSTSRHVAQNERPEKVVKSVGQALLKLIPHRIQELQVEHGTNPFASAMIILDKRSRKFYFAIDGKKSVAELANLERLEQKEILEVLQILLGQKYIQLYEPGGKIVETSSILKSF